MNFIGTGRRLMPADFAAVAEQYKLDPWTIPAVVRVEAGGRGFDAKSRLKILFEPHVFWRLLGKGAARDRAAREGLAYPKWGQKPYAKTSDGNYDRLIAAMLIDRDKALQSCSWGLPQIMGFNHKDAGYSSAAAMVDDFLKGEGAQLRAMCRLIDAWNIEDDLQRHDWSGFARRYNGPGFDKPGHEYHLKLAKAHRDLKRVGMNNVPAPKTDAIDVTVRVPVPVARPKDLVLVTEPAFTPEAMEAEREFQLAILVQKRLLDLGDYDGLIDGDMAGKGQTALLGFKLRMGLPLTTDIDEATLAALQVAPKLPRSEIREAAPKEVIKELPAVKRSKLKALIGKVLVAVGIPALGEEAGAFDQVKAWAGWFGEAKAQFTEVAAVLPPMNHLLIAAIITAGLIVWVLAKGEKLQAVADWRAGGKGA